MVVATRLDGLVSALEKISRRNRPKIDWCKEGTEELNDMATTTAKKKGSARSKARSKKSPSKKPAAASDQTEATKPKPMFRQVTGWPDMVGHKLLLWSPVLGMGPEKPNGYHRAKLKHVDLGLNTLVVQIYTPEIKGRYLIPLDTAAGRIVS